VILHDLEATVQASLVQRELESVRLRLDRLEAEDARLRRELRSRAPGIPQAPVLCGGGTHSEQISQRMLEYIHAHYHRPLQLSDLATALKMNACYLSSLFSRTFGLTFHQYLDELRLARAKELLCDPTYRVCEAAIAVGYASTPHFGRAFKAHTGVSPSVWRDGQRLSS
jgi:AraC-like DNA-binding protein